MLQVDFGTFQEQVEQMIYSEFPKQFIIANSSGDLFYIVKWGYQMTPKLDELS